MADYKYLIIGGGMTADAAVRGIRELDQSGLVGLLCSEACPPYDRPPLSKALWKGGQKQEAITWMTKAAALDGKYRSKLSEMESSSR